MKYAITWSKDFRHIKEIDEIIFSPYSGKDTLIESFQYNNIPKDKRIILNCCDFDIIAMEEAIVYINKAKAEGYNIAVQIWEDKPIALLLKDRGIDFMFLKFANTIDRAYSQAMMGASDVYVVENLGFRMKEVKALKEQFNISIRVIPNIAQFSVLGSKDIDPMKKFWIRPDDTEVYESVVDVFEIYGTARSSVVYEIYKDRRWLGDINDLILDFKTPRHYVTNSSMPPHIGMMRFNCGQRCLLGECNLCPQFAEVAQNFEDVGIELIRDKYIPEKTKEEKEALLKELKDRMNELRVNEEPVQFEN